MSRVDLSIATRRGGADHLFVGIWGWLPINVLVERGKPIVRYYGANAGVYAIVPLKSASERPTV
jgi:hypothetical protein